LMVVMVMMIVILLLLIMFILLVVRVGVMIIVGWKVAVTGVTPRVAVSHRRCLNYRGVPRQLPLNYM
jgi:hypothetical protein